MFLFLLSFSLFFLKTEKYKDQKRKINVLLHSSSLTPFLEVRKNKEREKRNPFLFRIPFLMREEDEKKKKKKKKRYISFLLSYSSKGNGKRKGVRKEE